MALMLQAERYIKIWLWSGIVLVASMVLIGGITRLTGSGLSIVEWKPITGIVPPLNHNQWQQEFDLYKQFPQYKKANHGMSLSEFKQIFFWEYLHRLLGRVIGVVFIIPFLIFYFKGWLSKKVAYPLLTIFILGAAQGFMGWYMVKSGLNTIPHVSHFRLAAHQGIALLLIASIYWMVLSLNKEKQVGEKNSHVLLLSFLTVLLLAHQIVLGSFVAGLKAGFSYTNFPWMGDSFFPSSSILASESFFYNGVALQFTHRWVAFFVLACIVGLWYAARTDKKLSVQVKWLVICTLIQISLGIITLLLAVPLVLGVMHQGMAILLLMVVINIIHIQLYSHQSKNSITAK